MELLKNITENEYFLSGELDLEKTEIKDKPVESDLDLVISFISPNLEVSRIIGQLNQLLNETTIVGCSTAGEMINHQPLDDSVVIFGFKDGVLADCTTQVFKDQTELDSSLEATADYFDVETPMDLEMEEYISLIFTDGLSGQEEAFMELINKQTNMLAVGGSAGDYLDFEQTFVLQDDELYFDSNLLLTLKPSLEFGVLKTQAFDSLDQTLEVTDVQAREVLEFNGRDAKQEYAKKLDCGIEELEDKFAVNPVGLNTATGVFVRSPQQLTEAGINFYCQVKEGKKVDLLEATDIVAETESALNKLEFDFGELETPKGILDFSCILRKLQLEDNGRREDYSKVYASVPAASFNTFGEQFLGHINQTSTMVIFGE